MKPHFSKAGLGAALRIAAAVSMLVASGPWACGADAAADAEKARALAGEAQTLKKNADLPGALKKATEAVNVLPLAIEPRIVRGGILMELERFKEALDDWSLVKTKMEPGSPLIYLLNLYSGECRLRLDDRAGARADLLEARRLAPATAAAEKVKQLGMLLRISLLPLDALWLGRTTESGRDVYSIWELHGDGRCVVHTQPFRKEGDYTIDTPTGKAWPNDASARIGRGVFENGRWRMTFTQPAGQTAEGTCKISQDQKTLVVKQDGGEGQLTRTRIAWFEVARLADLIKRPSELAREAMALKEQGDLPGALKKASEGVDLLGFAVEPRLARAAIYMELERYREALNDWSDIRLFLKPGDAHLYQVHLFRGQCRLKLGDAKGARADGLEAKSQAPKSIKPGEMKMIDELIGAAGRATQDDSLVVKDGKVTGSIEAFHKKQSELMDEAEALQKKGDLPAALKKATAAVDLLPLTMDPRVLRANLLMDLKRYRDALEDWSICVRNTAREDEEAYFYYFKRGDCRRLMGDRAGARADALEAKQLAPKSLTQKEREEIEKLLTMSSPLPLGAMWTRVKTEGDRQVFSVWELQGDGRCAVHLLPVRKDGKYRVGGPFGQPWPGDIMTYFGEATFAEGRWRMVFTQPPGKVAQGTYRLSDDQKTFIGTEEGIEGHFTRYWMGLGDDPEPQPAAATSPPTPLPTPKPRAGLKPATPAGRSMDYFAFGFVLTALGDHTSYQKAPVEKESKANRALIERLGLGSEVLARFDALDQLVQAGRLPAGKLADWSTAQKRRWDQELRPAVKALKSASQSAMVGAPEGHFFHQLGSETYVLAITVPEHSRDHGLRSVGTANHLRGGLEGFVWLRDHLPPGQLSPEVEATIATLAGYLARLQDLGQEPMPQPYVEKIVTLAGTIIDAGKSGKLLR